jgi:hypothetical protein
MPVTPTSSAGIALAQLRRMVSLSDAFQTAVDADDETEALDFILIGRHPYTSLPSGGAILYLAEQPLTYEMDAGGQQLWLHPTGGIVAQLILPQSAETAIEDGYLSGVDFSANVASDVKELSDSGDTGTAFGMNHLAITRLAIEYSGPADVRYDNSRGVVFLSKLFIDWGIN